MRGQVIIGLAILAALLFVLEGGRPASAWWIFADPAGPKKATATFDLDGVKGTFKFTQVSPSEPTSCTYDLVGLKGNNKLYHVHVRPVPPFDQYKLKNNATALAELCGDPATGGHLNPHHIKEKLPPKSAPFDKYETGDLAGKHGPLQPASADPSKLDRYQGSFVDDKLPMSGENSIIGRSIVIHKNDGKRWVCATIVETKQ